MRRTLRVFLLAFCCLSLPRFCMADGMMFSSVAAKVEIPDQSAVIGFDGATERLIVSTAFTGPAGEYAWVMPLPATPKVERVTNGILPTLRSMCRPRIEVEPRQSYWFLALGVSLWIAVFARRRRGLVIGTLLIAFALPWIFAILTSDIGCGMAGMPVSGGVSVQQRVRVGEFDVATVTARSADALLDWLKENGFKVGPAVAPALADYIRDGWCFTVYRFSPQNGSSRSHPLSFTFATKAAVYPMRLTGIESKGMSLELFVLGEEEATLPGLERRRCGYPRMLDRESFASFIDEEKHDGEIPVYHAGVKEIVKPYKVMTALYGILSPQQMARDYYIAWESPAPHRPVLYTEYAAAGLRRWYVAVVFSALTVLAVIWIGWRTYARRTFSPIPVTWIVWAAGAVATVRILAMLPHVWASQIPTGLLAAGFLLFFVIMWAAKWIPWQVRQVVFTPFYFVGVGVLSLALLLCGWWGSAWAYLIISGCAAALAFAGSLAWDEAPADRDRKFMRVDVLLMLFAILAGVATWSIAGVALRDRTTHSFVKDMEFQSTYWGLLDTGHKTGESALTFPTESAAREWFSQRVASLKIAERRNPFTGEPLCEEDSPGNYQLIPEKGHLAVYVYDANGGAQEAGYLEISGAVPAAP